jgi:OOP family OmpA-OmpF porin
MNFKTFRIAVLSLAVIAFGGCTAFSSFNEVDALNDAQAVGNPFTQALAEEYKLFANTELKDMFDYPDALHFARKGLAAASGDMVMPEPVSDWNLNKAAITDLATARGRLLQVYDYGARETHPKLSARAQGKYDCWIEREEENKDGKIVVCKQQFMEAIAELENLVTPPEPETMDDDVVFVDTPVAVPPMQGEGKVETTPIYVDETEPMAIENAMYLIFFNWDSAAIDDSAKNVIEAVVVEARKTGAQTVNVVGYTDTSGAKSYNRRLAFKRANAIKDALVKEGLSASLVAVDAKGEDDLLVETQDNIREPANRRVAITFQ